MGGPLRAAPAGVGPPRPSGARRLTACGITSRSSDPDLTHFIGQNRPGDAGANNAEDHLALLDLALEQLPQGVLDGEILAAAPDRLGASDDLADACRETAIRLSFGDPLTEPVRQALDGPCGIGVAAGGRSGRQPRDGAWVSRADRQVNLAAGLKARG